MKKHYALYRDGLLLIRTKTLAKARKIIIDQMDQVGMDHKYEIKAEEYAPAGVLLI